MPYDQVMHKFKHGTLKSSSGRPVTSRAQALAILESEKRAAGSKPEYRARPGRKKKPAGNHEPHNAIGSH